MPMPFWTTGFIQCKDRCVCVCARVRACVCVCVRARVVVCTCGYVCVVCQYEVGSDDEPHLNPCTRSLASLTPLAHSLVLRRKAHRRAPPVLGQGGGQPRCHLHGPQPRRGEGHPVPGAIAGLHELSGDIGAPDAQVQPRSDPQGTGSESIEGRGGEGRRGQRRAGKDDRVCG